MEKKQIVFLGTRAINPVLKISRSLRKTKKYETVLVCFSKIEKKFVKDSFDKIYCLDLEIAFSPRKLNRLLRKLRGEEGRAFFEKVGSLNPYIIQIYGPSIVSLFSFLLIKRKPKIFFHVDIWHYYLKMFNPFGRREKMQFINVLIEKYCFKKSDGVINRSGMESVRELKSVIRRPIVDFLPYCLDEWILVPKKKNLGKNKEIHVVYAGTSWSKWKGHASFPDMIQKVIDQGIHLHCFFSAVKDETVDELKKIAKTNKYLHIYPREDDDKITKKISKFDYAIHLDFCDDSVRKDWLDAGMSGKIFGYLEAGLPIIINKQFTNMCKIIEKEKFGKCISYKELDDLKKILEKYKYPSVKEIQRIQEKYRMGRHIHVLEKFYEMMHSRAG